MFDPLHLFVGDATVASISVADLAAWASGQRTDGARLDLPPIQRSLVWSNNQILDYWDSLLRGYPPGVMMLHRAEIGELGRTSDGRTSARQAAGFQLFDGQQRLNAILLGLGFDSHGKVEADRRIWIELSLQTSPTPQTTGSTDHRFVLRMNSAGQPFGYQVREPNQKYSVARRRQARDECTESIPSQEWFEKLTAPKTLIDSHCAIPLAEFIAALRRQSTEDWHDKPAAQEAMEAVKAALALHIPLLLLPGKLISEEDAYIRFFGRVGRGGSPLTDAELSYSIIKQRYPPIHDRVAEIVHASGAGRWIADVDITLAALRVAKALSVSQETAAYQLQRPAARDVQALPFRESKAGSLNQECQLVAEFKTLLPEHDAEKRLLAVVVALRKALVFDVTQNPNGLLPLMLPRLDRDLVDCLILFGVKRHVMSGNLAWSAEERDLLLAFVAYWMLFVHNAKSASSVVFRLCLDPGWLFGRTELVSLLQALDNYEGRWTRSFPRREELMDLAKRIADRFAQREAGQLNEEEWELRFAAPGADQNAVRTVSDIADNQSASTFALLWLQRDYLEKCCPGYDPTSGRDEDFPFDLDHLLPQSCWNFRWDSGRMEDMLKQMAKPFRWQRWRLGNSLGNLRFLTLGENRGRGADLLDKEVEPSQHLDAEAGLAPEEWNAIIEVVDPSRPWSVKRLRKFQELIEKRSVHLLRTILDETGLFALFEDETAVSGSEPSIFNADLLEMGAPAGGTT
ncbi:DUF262 domain-containing protein [Xanthobacter sp. V7C-4]|uniref:DUF262 domain-containing protein n=1 Tax=Xanthobacter autotrophicus (strain ATCC BAA-1158 / Py2) TaxID=78245 RepID=UPI0037294D61